MKYKVNNLILFTIGSITYIGNITSIHKDSLMIEKHVEVHSNGTLAISGGKILVNSSKVDIQLI